MYVLLAVLFALTFAVLGVGSGQGGLDQIFNTIFGGGGGTSVSSLEKKVHKDPRNAQAWNDLALKYGEKNRTEDAIAAMQRYVALRPKSVAGLNQLGQFQLQEAQLQANDWQQAQSYANAWAGQGYRPVVVTGKLAQGLGTDPLASAAQQQGSTAQAAASVKRSTAQATYRQALATFRKVAVLQPRSADAETQIAIAAETALNALQDTSFVVPEVAAYRKLVELDPTNASQYRAKIKQLKPFLPSRRR